MTEEFNPELELAKDMGRFFDDPLGWVMYAFPWDEGELTGFTGPDDWQKEFLSDWGAAIKKNGFNGVDPVDSYMDATSSGHGIGKSALVSWIILFIMSTRPMCKGVVTANTSEQLRTKTWGELGKWRKRCITGHWFVYNNGKGNMNLYHAEHQESWRVDGQTCREENSESFAGLHAADSSPFYIFDEASAVPDTIWEVAEGGQTDGEPFWFCFGNPTRNTGRFRECFRKFKHRWNTRQVDSRTAKMTNKKKIQEWLEDYGLDSDFFKVRVRGMFPSASDVQFIGSDIADAMLNAQILKKQVRGMPRIIGVDPAYDGTDMMVIYLRQGLFSKLLGRYQKSDDTLRSAKIIAGFEDEYQADAVFIDYGYGTGIYDIGKSWNRDWQLVKFGGASTDPAYLNKRGQMWGDMKEWGRMGGSVDDQDTYDQLMWPEYKVRLDGKIVLESKEDMKKRLGASPNEADALALTFAFPVAPKVVPRGTGKKVDMANVDYDPYNV